MIETIIKRDGRKEDFQPSKVNAWGEWASKTLGTKVDWPSVVLQTVSTLPKVCTSEALQERLIKTCLDYGTWSYNRMAGRLLAALLYKKIHGGKIPTVKELHDKLVGLGLMVKLNYTDEEYAHIEKLIDHKRDLRASHFELHQVRTKYSIQNRVTGEEYETQQFVYMRMAMALAEESLPENRLKDVEKLYNYLSKKKINAPTPNFVNLGTPLNGYASCCVYTTNDTAPSLAAGSLIAYTMTYMSAGIGAHINTRSLGDPVRGGAIEHQGKLNYYRDTVASVKANLQNGRGGAATMHYSIYDPEVEVISQLKNPMSTEDKKIRGMDYSAGTNKFFARKAARKEKIFTFNSFTAPDLYDALYSADEEEFERLYTKYENDKNFKKNWIDARDLILTILNEGFETGRAYLHWTDELNRHTPFKEKIYSSNLCQEIALPTKGYKNSKYLYMEEDHGEGEVALCSLGGINITNIRSDEEYEDVMYYTLLMIDRCIHKAHYELPHIGFTAKARLNAGVGIMGLAHAMARANVKYSTPEGKRFIHEVAERHMYFAIRASLRLGKELGNAPWIHKTKWPEGWLPIDTYNKSVDEVVDSTLNYDWEKLRKEIIDNGGIRNSALVAHMPGESSSKASGTTNGLYPIRDFDLLKTDNNSVAYWSAPEGDKLGNRYEIATDIPTKDMIDCYAIVQKFTDQGISADLYRDLSGDAVVTTTEMLKDYLYMTKMGLKTRYYVVSKTAGTDCETCTI